MPSSWVVSSALSHSLPREWIWYTSNTTWRNAHLPSHISVLSKIPTINKWPRFLSGLKWIPPCFFHVELDWSSITLFSPIRLTCTLRLAQWLNGWLDGRPPVTFVILVRLKRRFPTPLLSRDSHALTRVNKARASSTPTFLLYNYLSSIGSHALLMLHLFYRFPSVTICLPRQSCNDLWLIKGG